MKRLADDSLRRDEAAVSYVSDTVYTGPTGRTLVSQHVHYLHRDTDFASYNLNEYASIVSISPRKPNSQSSDPGNELQNAIWEEQEEINTR